MQKSNTTTSKLLYSLRKKPRQKRSQILFDKILTTAKKLFEQEGYAYVSTNQIAEHANISIGSLYQYFPNCESIALAIYEQSSARATLEMKRRATEIINLPLEKSLPKIISNLTKIFEEDSFVLLHLIDEVPELRVVAQAFSFDNLIHSATVTYLELHYPDVNNTRIIRKAYLVEKSIIGTMRHYLKERPENITRSQIAAELTAMVQPYLATLLEKDLS